MRAGLIGVAAATQFPFLSEGRRWAATSWTAFSAASSPPLAGKRLVELMRADSHFLTLAEIETRLAWIRRRWARGSHNADGE